MGENATVDIETGEIIAEEPKKKGKKKSEAPASFFKEYKVRLTFREELLGTASSDPNVHEKFIASKAPDAPTREEEVESLGVEEVTHQGMTIFSRNKEGEPILWNYQIRGFFKSAAKAIAEEIPDLKVTAYKSNVDEHLFVLERQIVLHIPEGEQIGSCQRPLRAETAQGPRVALANSETCPAGTWCEFTILNKRPDKITDEHIEMWLYKGRHNGIGQWRNSGKGIFKAKILETRTIDAREYYRSMYSMTEDED